MHGRGRMTARNDRMNDDSCRANDGFLAVRSEVLRELGLVHRAPTRSTLQETAT